MKDPKLPGTIFSTAEELSAMKPEDLGRIDTFREEESRVLFGAVEALRRGDWATAAAWNTARLGENSFWLARSFCLQPAIKALMCWLPFINGFKAFC